MDSEGCQVRESWAVVLWVASSPPMLYQAVEAWASGREALVLSPLTAHKSLNL